MRSVQYYEVFVAETSHQKSDPLTYSFSENLQIGSVVIVPYGRKSVSGFIHHKVAQPEFKTKAITEVISEAVLPPEALRLYEWMLQYYPSGSGSLTQSFIPSGLQTKPRDTKSKPKAKHPATLPALTGTQQQIIADIEQSEKKAFLLHGETGSGKTRIYLEHARRALAADKSALILAPEISLIPQVAAFFEQAFPDHVIQMHSGLTKATRNKNWLKIAHAKEPFVIIGTRSALFAPIKRIGFIAVDEMHEPAYKQESAPRYYGLRVAGALARFHNAEIIYGSATPPVTEYFVAEQTDTPILRMDSTARPSERPASTVIDLKDSSLFAKNRYLSDRLIAAITKRLEHREQSLLFLNRRGTFRTVLCQNCGWQAVCPRCDLPLTYHNDQHHLRCHTCGYTMSPPYACPTCGSDDITYRSQGTKALVDSLQQLFPEALIKRFDTDNLADEQLGRNFAAVHSGEVDILVGTQMLGKGLDLPKLSLVGIVNADTSLNTPDFSANERSYQLLHQAIGRVGRGHLKGEIIVQSFHPENPTLQAALRQDWKALYDQEIAERKAYGFPPFYFLLKITVSRKTSGAAETYMQKLHQAVRAMPLRIKVNEPTPSFYERSHGRYNWQMVLRAKSRSQLLAVVKSLPAGDYTYDLDPINLL